MLHIKSPASSANLGPGFDCLGAALQLYNETWIKIGDKTVFEIEGEGIGDIPKDESNLFYVSFKKFYDYLSKKPPKIFVKQLNRIPVERGLGASAATIVGGLLAASRISGVVLSDEDFLALATELEGHSDNVCAAYLGGLTVSFRENSKVFAQSFTPSNLLDTLVLIPEHKLSTKVARDVLPKNVSLNDAVFNLSRVSLLVGGLIEGNMGVLSEATKDVLHQPYRIKLLPKFEEALKVLSEIGIKAAALSGAGPTIIAFINHGDEFDIKEILNQKLIEADLPYCPNFLEFDTIGAWAST